MEYSSGLIGWVLISLSQATELIETTECVTLMNSATPDLQLCYLPSLKHHRPLASTKLHCLMNNEHNSEQLAHSRSLLETDLDRKVGHSNYYTTMPHDDDNDKADNEG